MEEETTIKKTYAHLVSGNVKKELYSIVIWEGMEFNVKENERGRLKGSHIGRLHGLEHLELVNANLMMDNFNHNLN